MSKIFKLLLIFIFITNCSFHKSSKFWNKENIKEEKNKNITEIFKKEEKINFEFNPNLKIELDSRAVSNSFFKVSAIIVAKLTTTVNLRVYLDINLKR